MAYTLSAVLYLGAANTGLTLTPSLRDGANAVAAGLTTSTMVEVAAGSGTYLWTGTIPDGHRGYIRFQDGATFKTAVGINPQTAENLDQKVSTLNVSLALAAAAAAALTVGSSVGVVRGDTWSISITALGSLVGRSKLWFTVKRNTGAADADAVIQIEESGGLLRLNGAAATSGQGSLVVTDAGAGNITVTLDEVASAQIAAGVSPAYAYDVQVLNGGNVTTLAFGSLQVTADATRATS